LMGNVMVQVLVFGDSDTEFGSWANGEMRGWCD